MRGRWDALRGSEQSGKSSWLGNSWPGIGALVVGMAAQGCDLQLTEYAGANWRATFFVTGMAHSIVKGLAYEDRHPVRGL